jgi:hypothetical protein
MQYRVSAKCVRTNRVYHDLATRDVSASGMQIEAPEPLGVEVGDRIELSLYATIDGESASHGLQLATHATVVRATPTTAALSFHGPLVY